MAVSEVPEASEVTEKGQAGLTVSCQLLGTVAARLAPAIGRRNRHPAYGLLVAFISLSLTLRWFGASRIDWRLKLSSSTWQNLIFQSPRRVS